MSLGLLGLLVGAWLWLPPAGIRRLPQIPLRSRRWAGQDLAAAVAGLAVALLVEGILGVALGLIVGIAARFGLSRIGEGDRGRGQALARMAPDAVDCLAACLAAGAPLWSAMSVVAQAYPQPMREVLDTCIRRHDMGSTPEQTFAGLLGEPALAPVGRVLVRSAESGSALVTSLMACSARLRQDWAAQVDRKARAVGVKAVGPLGLCFLPAFVLLAVVPIVGSMLQRLL